METIKNYLENMFQALPKTEEILRLKNELLLNMEEKYTELKSHGKTENEAIGIVISMTGLLVGLSIPLQVFYLVLLPELIVQSKKITNIKI